MQEIKMFKIGERVYFVKPKFQRVERMYMLDDEGNRWYRYPEPSVKYSIEEYQLVGTMTEVWEGEPVDDSDNRHSRPETEYHFKSLGSYPGMIVYSTDTDLVTQIFRTLEDAEKHRDNLQASQE
jgi:hypothetical protein